MPADNALEEAAQPTVRRLLAKRIGLAVLSIVLVSAVLYLRKPDAFANPQFWAEDAKVFFKDAHQLGHRSVLREYSGYLHFFPRLVAYVATKLPYEFAPALFNFSSGAVALLAVALLHSPRLGLRAPTLFALALVAIPHIGGEVFMNLTNSQWSLALILLITVTQAPPEKAQTFFFDAALITLTGLSGPSIVPATLLLAWRWFHNRSHLELTLLALSGLISTVQVATFLNHRITMPPSPNSDATAWPIVLGPRMIGTLLGGARHPFTVDPRWWCAGGLALIAFILWRLFVAKKARVGLPWLLFGCAVALMAFYKFRLAIDLLIPPAAAPRHFYVFSVTIAWCLLLLLLHDRSRVAQAVSLVLLIAIVRSAALSDFASPSWRDFRWSDYAPLIERSEHVVVPINPPGWHVTFDGPP